MRREVTNAIPPGRGLKEPASGEEEMLQEPSPGTLQCRYQEVRSLTETLCLPLEIEDYVIQSMPDASPAKWHLAHTTWFFETFILKRARSEYREVHPAYSYLFNSYYNAVGPMHCRPKRGVISRPTVKETFLYRREVDNQMSTFLTELDAGSWAEQLPVVVLGLNHEQQHQELLVTDLKHLFAQNPLYPAYCRQSIVPGGPVPSQEWIGFSDGLFSVGHTGMGFAFDNETPRHQTFVRPFQLGSRLVTNGEYLRFIEDRGYERPELWLSLGWATLNENKWDAPLYWHKRDGQWHQFTLSGLRPVNESEPVCHVSYFEADAYARWAGARLPTEAEWEIASETVPITGNFVERGLYHPEPLRAPTSGLCQMFGDVWEWTRSSYSPYPGYAPPTGALGEYNGKFMCNQYVLRGGSCATSQTHIRRSYRNFFPPDKRWQFTGIRLAKDT